MWLSRSPRAAPSRSNSRLTGRVIACTTASAAALRHHGAAEIGVQHGAGQIEYTALAKAAFRASSVRCAVATESRRRRSCALWCACARSARVQQRAQRFEYVRAAVASTSTATRLSEQPVDRWKRASAAGCAWRPSEPDRPGKASARRTRQPRGSSSGGAPSLAQARHAKAALLEHGFLPLPEALLHRAARAEAARPVLPGVRRRCGFDAVASRARQRTVGVLRRVPGRAFEHLCSGC